MSAGTCNTCRFWAEASCRRFPPQFAPWPTDNQHPILYEPMPGWPATNAKDWCGEWVKDLALRK